jgi:hypothetical protein
MRRRFAAHQVRIVRAFYPFIPAFEIADRLHCTVSQVHAIARKIGVTKDSFQRR